MSCLLENKFKKELQLAIYEGDTMEDRDDALDFIYKGFRDGRQNRRDFRRQRGIDRLRSTLAPTLEPQRSGYIQPQQEMASSPPAQESTTFGDDITTPDDESTPQNEAAPPVQEAVASPPTLSPEELQEQFANLGVPGHKPKGGSNAARHDYVKDGFPTQTPDITQNVPEAAPVQPQTPERSLGTRAEGDDPFPTNYNDLSDEQRSRIVEDMGRRHQDFNLGTEQYTQAVKDGVITQQEADQKIREYKERIFREVPEEHHPQTQTSEQIAEPSDKQRAVQEATQSEDPFEPPTREETEHSNAFEEAYLGMVDDTSEVTQGVNQGINESFNEFNRIGRELGNEPEAQPTPKPTPPPKESKATATSAGKKRVTELANELNAQVGRSMGNSKPTPKEESKVPKLGSSPKGEDVLSVIEMVRDGDADAKSELYNALGDLEDNDSPHYDDALEAISDFNNSSSNKKKK